MDDLIDRQAAIRAVSQDWMTSVAKEILTEKLTLLPSAQPEQKTVIYSGDGYTDGHMVYDLAECPECGYEYEEGDMSWGEPYCPHCGQSLNWDTEGDWKWMT